MLVKRMVCLFVFLFVPSVAGAATVAFVPGEPPPSYPISTELFPLGPSGGFGIGFVGPGDPVEVNVRAVSIASGDPTTFEIINIGGLDQAIRIDAGVAAVFSFTSPQRYFGFDWIAPSAESLARISFRDGDTEIRSFLSSDLDTAIYANFLAEAGVTFDRVSIESILASVTIDTIRVGLVAVTPLPASAWLFAAGLAAFAVRRRRIS